MRKLMVVFVLISVCACTEGVPDASSSSHAANRNFCPRLFDLGTIALDFNPAFVHVAENYLDDGQGTQIDSIDLIVSSFFNTHNNPNYNPDNPPGPMNLPFVFFERDLVARIPDILAHAPKNITADQVEILTDRHLPLCSQLDPTEPCSTVFPANTAWPNAAKIVPDDVFDFDALVIPQGFFSGLKSGRLSLVDLSNPNKAGHYPEYVVHQSGTDPQTNPDRFYHKAIFVDMNKDGRKDIVTVRSGMRVGAVSAPPLGELVWFEHPTNYDGSQPWAQHVIYSMPFPGTGPDINLAAADLDGDQVVEIVATHFFTGDKPDNLGPRDRPPHGKVVLYGVPAGFSDWSNVNNLGPNPPRTKVLTDDQGHPFDVHIADLNHDGLLDILVTNHETIDPALTDGRVFALEQPRDGDLFGGQWQLHMLLEGIRPYPQPNGPPARGHRMAPGVAKIFYSDINPAYYPLVPYVLFDKPDIVVSGDEAGKIWILRAKSQKPTKWKYASAVVFDINDTYGEGTSQTPDEYGRTISTIGEPGLFNGPIGGEIYIPVFEAKEIHVLSTESYPSIVRDRVKCVKK